MGKSQMNTNLELAINAMKKDIVRNGGSCIFIIANDGELMQEGGGESQIMKHCLIDTLGQIEMDSMDIVRINPFLRKN